MLQDGLDLGLHFVQAFRVRFLLVIHTNNVEAVAALHEIADLTLGKRERSLLKLGDCLAFPDPAKRSAQLCAARIFRIFLGQVFQLCDYETLTKEALKKEVIT